MSEQTPPRILIVGAGSMGIITGYHLTAGGADVTFLIRPHREAELNKPQILYCYDDNQLKEFSKYAYNSDPSEIAAGLYDYILITLDGVSLRNEAGIKVVEAIGDAARGKDTRIILGTVGIHMRQWFLATSNLPAEQVTNGVLGIQSYPTKAVTLPVHEPTDPALLAQADLGYRHCFPFGFMVDDSAPAAAEGFSAIYNSSGLSTCAIEKAPQYAVFVGPLFAVFAACELMDWPKFKDIDPTSENWQLAIAAVKEIQGLDVLGEPGQSAASATNAVDMAAFLAAWEKDTLPLELQEFNRYHHGRKVNAQDRQHLYDALAIGEGEGKPMTSLRTLLARVSELDAAQLA